MLQSTILHFLQLTTARSWCTVAYWSPILKSWGDPLQSPVVVAPMFMTTQVSRYQKGKTNLDLLVQETVSGSGIS